MQITKLVCFILLCQVPALIGAKAVQNNMVWYHTLTQPFFAPPDWLFGTMWTVLYVLMGVAGYYLTRDGFHARNRKVLFLFAAQLAANACWTPVFFGAHAVMAALGVLTLLLFLTGWLLRESRSVSRTAFWLLMPYFLWLCFAWALNLAILILN